MSFFEKLKKNIGIETDSADTIPAKSGKKSSGKKNKTDKAKSAAEEPQTKEEVPRKKIKALKMERKSIPIREEKESEEEKEQWPASTSARQELEPEGELAIDVSETDNDFIIQSTISGLKAQDLDISVENDTITIRGKRQKQTEAETKNYLLQECYWGSFSRQIILPEEVDGSKAQATMKDGVLTLRIPKIHRKTKKTITVRQED